MRRRSRKVHQPKTDVVTAEPRCKPRAYVCSLQENGWELDPWPVSRTTLYCNMHIMYMCMRTATSGCLCVVITGEAASKHQPIVGRISARKHTVRCFVCFQTRDEKTRFLAWWFGVVFPCILCVFLSLPHTRRSVRVVAIRIKSTH